MKKDLSYYIKKDFDYDGKGYYVAEIPDLPGCGAEGETIEEVLKKIQEAKEAWLEVSLERGLEIPEPKDNVNCITIYDVDPIDIAPRNKFRERKNNECKSS